MIIIRIRIIKQFLRCIVIKQLCMVDYLFLRHLNINIISRPIGYKNNIWQYLPNLLKYHITDISQKFCALCIRKRFQKKLNSCKTGCRNGPWRRSHRWLNTSFKQILSKETDIYCTTNKLSFLLKNLTTLYHLSVRRTTSCWKFVCEHFSIEDSTH